MSGFFLTIEGGEGSGKSTAARALTARLLAEGLDVLALREPGGTPVGDRVREVLLDVAHCGMEPAAELLLYEASRAELVAKRVRPHLEGGGVVLCDRFADSTLAYQGYGRGLDLAMLAGLNRLATGGLVPDLTVLFDVDVAVGLRRATGSGADRLEREERAFHERVRAGFLALASAEPARFEVVDAAQPLEAQIEAACEVVRARLALAGMVDSSR